MARTATGLDRLPLVDEETGDYTVVLETPKGSRNKYKYDPGCMAIRLGAILAEGLVFPYDFGFFPSTVGDDGDPLDVLLFLDEPLPPGCVATARLIGALEVEQKQDGQPWQRNDRLLAVATHAHTHEDIKRLSDLRPHLLPEIEAFFSHYAGMNGKELRFVGRCGPNRAAKLVKAGAKAFKAKH
ncbi:MAG: inorganic diphosphatase [Alphaproteobacteria bacterium]|nr:inorganic diphosphatase [Alphaproteobacteria bacterium]MBV8406481.1 inorganic diphosphatase [Alphaproteobacteria bacterium]